MTAADNIKALREEAQRLRRKQAIYEPGEYSGWTIAAEVLEKEAQIMELVESRLDSGVSR